MRLEYKIVGKQRVTDDKPCKKSFSDGRGAEEEEEEESLSSVKAEWRWEWRVPAGQQQHHIALSFRRKKVLPVAWKFAMQILISCHRDGARYAAASFNNGN